NNLGINNIKDYERLKNINQDTINFGKNSKNENIYEQRMNLHNEMKRLKHDIEQINQSFK
ncbi:MAG: hypothetical protein ACK55Z_08810, partial [bacterium]